MKHLFAFYSTSHVPPSWFFYASVGADEHGLGSCQFPVFLLLGLPDTPPKDHCPGTCNSMALFIKIIYSNRYLRAVAFLHVDIRCFLRSLHELFLLI